MVRTLRSLAHARRGKRCARGVVCGAAVNRGPIALAALLLVAGILLLCAAFIGLAYLVSVSR